MLLLMVMAICVVAGLLAPLSSWRLLGFCAQAGRKRDPAMNLVACVIPESCSHTDISTMDSVVSDLTRGLSASPSCLMTVHAVLDPIFAEECDEYSSGPCVYF